MSFPMKYLSLSVGQILKRHSFIKKKKKTTLISQQIMGLDQYNSGDRYWVKEAWSLLSRGSPYAERHRPGRKLRKGYYRTPCEQRGWVPNPDRDGGQGGPGEFPIRGDNLSRDCRDQQAFPWQREGEAFQAKGNACSKAWRMEELAPSWIQT